jgi:hypothetical protein
VGIQQQCPECSHDIDWWKTAQQVLKDNFMGNLAYSLVGCPTSIFGLVLRPNERTTYRFSEFGIPVGARVLYINYTPQGKEDGLFPVEVHGNVSTQRFRSDEISLFPVPIANHPNAVETKVSVMVSWIPQHDADEGWQNLFDAFEAFVAKQYPFTIVPANVAVESSLVRLMSCYLDRFVGKKRTEDFLQNAATYSHQLNVLLPMLAKLSGIPVLPPYVVGSLNRLRGFRNELAHGGIIKETLDSNSVAEVLCAALFGFHYVRYVHSKIDCPVALVT